MFGVAGRPGSYHAKVLVVDDVVAPGRVATNVRGLMRHWSCVGLLTTLLIKNFNILPTGVLVVAF